jgi:EAL domain-containing protein (putative c-di-GMP-specific phosphodiesterase class I)
VTAAVGRGLGLAELHCVLPRVLAVDDDDLFLRAIRRMLGQTSFQVETVSTSTKALALIEAGLFDVVVADMYMPELSGLGLLQATRKFDGNLPFVLMTGSPSIDLAVSAIDLGAHKFLSKPFSAEQLAQAVTEALGRRTGWFDLKTVQETFDRSLESLCIAYQPVVDTAARRVRGFEGRVQTTVEPHQLLAIAGKMGRLYELGRATRSAMAADLRASEATHDVFVPLQAHDLTDPELYLNDSPLGKLAARVVLELTASGPTDHELRDRALALRAMGFRIAIDDVSALGLTEPDLVKLNESLIRGIDGSGQGQLFVTSLLELGHASDFEVLASAVESVNEFETLQLLGVSLMHGPLFPSQRPLEGLSPRSAPPLLPREQTHE